MDYKCWDAAGTEEEGDDYEADSPAEAAAKYAGYYWENIDHFESLKVTTRDEETGDTKAVIIDAVVEFVPQDEDGDDEDEEEDEDEGDE